MRILARMSIRWRIALGSLVIAALFFGLAAAVFRDRVESILSATNETVLEHDAAPIKAELLNGATQVDAPGRGQLVSVVDPAGVVRRTTLPGSLDRRLGELLRLHGEPSTVTTPDAQYLVLTQTVAATGGNWRVITARNEEASTLLLDGLTQAMFIAALILVVGFGGASWLLTGAALRPVSRMRREAQKLSAQGAPRRLAVGPARDELSALATTLNRFIAELNHSALRERQMVSDASHELRGPIAVLKTQLELAHLSSGDAEALEAEISAAELSVERLSALATSLLELSQVEAGPTDVSSSWPELVAELAAAVDRARIIGAGATIDFETQGVEDGAVAGSGEVAGAGGNAGATPRYPIAAVNFGRLIDNLTRNAIGAVPDGGDIQLVMTRTRQGLTLTVTDSGPGMPEDFMPVAFDRFTRPDHARTARSGGNGLGLAIVNAIVVRALGVVQLANRPEGGFVVTIELPELAGPAAGD